MLNRHQGAAAPLAVKGRLFVQGDESIQAYDSYNGLKLWERANPGAVRTGVFRNYEPGNLAADDRSLFVVVGDHCLRLDGATGERGSWRWWRRRSARRRCWPGPAS